MIDRFKDWINLRGKTRVRIQRNAAKAATRRMASKHRRHIRLLKAEIAREEKIIDAQTKHLHQLETRLLDRDRELQVDREDLDMLVAKVKGGMLELHQVLNYFRKSLGQVFASFDKMNDTVEEIDKAQITSRKRRKK